MARNTDNDEQEPAVPIEISYNNKLKKRKFKQIFGDVSDLDDEIDIPERMQFSEDDHPLDETSIGEESNWIYAQLTSLVPDHSRLEKDHIANFLVLHHVQKLDIPFIAMYRKEQCMSLFEINTDDDHQKKPETKWHKLLWVIHYLDRQWLLLRKRKILLLGYYSKRSQQESSPANRILFESVIKSVKAAETEREVDDVDSKFSLHFPPCAHDERPTKRSLSHYIICTKSGLREVANKFGYSAEQQMGLALSLVKVAVDIEDAPEEMALNYVCAMFGDPQAVLTGARHVAATEISCEPWVKQYVRGMYMQNALVSVSPTPHGNMAIDSFHQLSGVKWLREKPLSMFEGTQWLLIHKAEEDNLLQVSFKLPENYTNLLVTECNKHYLSVGKYAQLWDEQRKLLLEEALDDFLLPSMEKEARLLLTSRAKIRLLSEYGQILWDKVSAGPYPKNKTEISTNEEAAPRVLACCWGPGNPETTFVMLDSSGELLDVLYAGSIALPQQKADNKQRIRKDQDRLFKFMKYHKPGVVALGAASLSCPCLKDNIYEVMFEVAEEIIMEVPNWTDDLRIVYADESLPRLYENSRISGEQLPQQSGIERRAVALGRYLQNPLAMVATLCGPGREILSWNLHSLECFLEPDDKYRMVEQVMIDITNQVGIDINMAASHEWFFSPLQFISGLGPRKAASLQKSLTRAGSVFDRKDLINHGLAKNVFANAAGFLRIRRSGLAASSSQIFDLLDDTRIHPESYGLAQEVAREIYDLRGDSNYGEDAMEHARDLGAASLRKVVLDEYLGSRKRESKKETYGSIIRELCCGFQDWRRQYKEPSSCEELSMISGETITEGRIVQATVQKVRSGRAVCVLDCGLTGTVLKEDYSDDGRNIVDLSNRLCEGDILTCKIKSTQRNLPRIFLVCKESEMRNKSHLDPYYHGEEGGDSFQIEKDKDRFEFRMIVHPCFRNITAGQATEYLSDKQFGESVVRPSSRGVNYLTLTLKIYDNVYMHKEIVEGLKDKEDIRIGKIMKIGKEIVDGLDLLMDWYVRPLVAHLLTMLNHRKFRPGTQQEVDDLLRVEKGENPTLVVYGFGVSHEHPGTFILSYIRCINPHHEYIRLAPEGFKFRKRLFRDIDKLVTYFKRHIDGRPVHY